MRMGYGFEACDEKVSPLTAHSGARARFGVQSAVRDAAVCEFGEIRLTSPLSKPTTTW